MQSTDIPTKLIKELCDFFSQFIYKGINHYIAAANFIADLKEIEVCPLYKYDARADRSNGRPISILPNLSKICEGCMLNYMLTLTKTFFQNTNVAFVKISSLSNTF